MSELAKNLSTTALMLVVETLAAKELYDINRTTENFEFLCEKRGKLETYIAELEAEQRWAPLEDPPKFDGRYLLRNIYGDVYSSKYVVKTETWVVHDFAMFTHWMPLPSAPESEDE